MFWVSKLVVRSHFRHYVLRTFQWYKGLFNPMGFSPCNRPLKIWESIRAPTPKMGVHLGMWGSFPCTLLHSQEHEMWLRGFILDSHLHKPLHWSRGQNQGCDTKNASNYALTNLFGLCRSIWIIDSLVTRPCSHPRVPLRPFYLQNVVI